MKFWTLTVLAALLFAGIVTAGTAPTAWDTTTPGAYLPNCEAGSVTHWEIPATYGEVKTNIQIFDSLRAAGYTNIRFFYAGQGVWIWSGDCTQAT